MTISDECFKCQGPFQQGDLVLVHKKYPDGAAFHEGVCHGPHRDYVIITWPPQDLFSEKEKSNHS